MRRIWWHQSVFLTSAVPTVKALRCCSIEAHPAWSAWTLDARQPSRVVRLVNRTGFSFRAVTAEQLFAEGGLLRLCAGSTFDVIFVPGDRSWLTAPGFLSALRWLLQPADQLIWATTSREAFPSQASAVGYFELLDALEGARLGPVTMPGQSPFYAAALAPFGATDQR